MFTPLSCDFLYYSFFATVNRSSPPPPPFIFFSFFPQIIQTSSAAPVITTCKCLYLHRHHLTPFPATPPACMNVHHMTLTSPTPFSPKPASLYCFVMITSFPLPHHLHFLKYCTRTEALYFLLIGASLSEPHSYVLTWTFVIGDTYINRASDRLALCPRRSKPKSRANPVLRLCLPLAFNDNDFLSKGCLCKSPVFCFVTHCIGCSTAL